MKLKLKQIVRLAIFLTFIVLTTQAQTPDEILPLLPGQTLEREMTGAQTHRYKFELKTGEFFQVSSCQ